MKLFESEIEARLVLQKEADKLLAISKKIWGRYLASYKPKRYAEHLGQQQGTRTGKSLESMKIIPEIVKISDDELGIRVTFEDNLAYHNSVMKKGEKGHAIWLISTGWKVRKGKHKNIYRFGYYEGFDFIDKVFKEYERVKDPRINLELEWNRGK